MKEENIEQVIDKFLILLQEQSITNNMFESICIAENRTDVFLYFEKSVEKFILYIENKIEKQYKKNLDLNNIKGIRNKIFTIISTRIITYSKMNNYKEYLKELLYFNRIIGNTKYSYNIADETWRIIEDKSTDINFYTKRISLGLIYIQVIRFLIKDNSIDCSDTLNYLDTKLNQIIKFNSIKSKIKKIFKINK